ncbi:hypothetical protein J1N35_043674 [Gossypium stocksii]|uniref:Uncharacterized protein n=1 Tax=Gossypium stocksii TaxID=47602 RepID=A0A9D3U7Z9_9ROSI|nr:hypothetical protein J1N35_043674 [Gossypium stocksii]
MECSGENFKVKAEDSVSASRQSGVHEKVVSMNVISGDIVITITLQIVPPGGQYCPTNSTAWRIVSLGGYLHMVRDNLKRAVLSAIEGDNEPKKALPKLGLIVNGVEAKRVKKNEKKGIKLVHIRENLGKLGLSVSELSKKIKMVNSKEVPTVGVAQGVELQIGQWKGKEDFELTEDVHYGKNIDLVDQSAKETSLEMLKVRKSGDANLAVR